MLCKGSSERQWPGTGHGFSDGGSAIPAEPLDEDLVAAILKNLKDEPSAHLQQMMTAPGGGHWSPEAVEAARRLLDRRTQGRAAEPVIQMDPDPDGQSPVGPRHAGNLVLATGYCAPVGFAWLAFLGRFFGRSTFRPARVGEVRGGAVFVYFYDGERGWVRRANVRPFEADIGGSIYCNWRGQGGQITAWRPSDESFHVRYADGQGQWVPLKRIVVPRGQIDGQ